MGEIADMMINGEMCAMCGEFLHDGEDAGYPRYCSMQCAKDAGIEEKDAKYLIGE